MTARLSLTLFSKKNIDVMSVIVCYQSASLLPITTIIDIVSTFHQSVTSLSPVSITAPHHVTAIIVTTCHTIIGNCSGNPLIPFVRDFRWIQR